MLAHKLAICRRRTSRDAGRAFPALALLAALILAGCGSDGAARPSRLDAAGARADPMLVFSAGTSVDQPVRSVLGQVRSHSCAHPYDPGAADGDALSKLESQAARLGANGLTDVEIERFSVNGGKNPCWRGSRAKGTAVLFAVQAAAGSAK